MFCIDIRTDTYPGIGYENGTWDASNVPNVGYIARILNDYYPNTGEPAAAPNDNVRAAAVQAAIWYFSDNYVLQPNEPVRAYTEAIVEAARTAGPLPQPSPPNLVIDPTTDKGPANEPLGPYTVSSDSTDPDLKITVSSTGGTMYSDAAGTTPIANGTAVVNGAKIYLRPDDEKGGGNVTLAARGVATVPSGNVYLYDGNTPGVNDAQRLILAQDAEVSALTSATGTFDALSSLKVTKTIAGSSAGQQGPITVHVACDNGHKQDIEIPANQPAGDTSTTIDDLPVGTVCTVTEPENGSTNAVAVTTTTEGNPATIAADEIVGVDVTNTYEPRLSSLKVTKTIAGSAAGQQDPITLHVSCDNGLEQNIDIPANQPAGDTSTTINDLPVGTVCTVTEPKDGSTDTVTVTTTTEGNPATITADQVGVDVTNTYQTALSSLRVTKTIAGGAAGDQGAVTLHVACDNGLARDIDIPAKAAAGDTATTIEDLPVGTKCTVTEPADGSSTTVTVTTTIDGSPATITADQVADVTVTNTYQTSTTPYTPPDTDDETSTSSQSGENLASTGATAGIGLMAALGIALIVAAGAMLSASHRRQKAK